MAECFRDFYNEISDPKHVAKVGSDVLRFASFDKDTGSTTLYSTKRLPCVEWPKCGIPSPSMVCTWPGCVTPARFRFTTWPSRWVRLRSNPSNA
jgi:hypothetical protein